MLKAETLAYGFEGKSIYSALTLIKNIDNLVQEHQ